MSKTYKKPKMSFQAVQETYFWEQVTMKTINHLIWRQNFMYEITSLNTNNIYKEKCYPGGTESL